MKTVKQHDAKAPRGQSERLSVRVSAEAYERLFVASVMGRSTASEILDRLILAHCREWSLPGKIAARVNTTDRHVDAPCVSSPEEIAA